MSRTHGWYPKPKYSTAGLKVSQEDWDRIFGRKLGVADQQRDMNLLQKPVPPAQSSLTLPSKGSKKNS